MNQIVTPYSNTPSVLLSTDTAAEVRTAIGLGGLTAVVMNYGAVGDGAANDTAAILAAMAAGGGVVYFPAGTYAIDGLTIASTANFQLHPNATIKHIDGGSTYAIVFNGTSLTIEGGTVDGNQNGITSRPYLISGKVNRGSEIVLRNVHFRNTVASIVYAQEFGGRLTMEHCLVTDQAEHSGVPGEATTILRTISGQQPDPEKATGSVTFSHNVCIGTDAPVQIGGSPGGIFLAVNGYVAGEPGSEEFAIGNLTTLEAIGNYFWGYGQHCTTNDISPLHTYPAVGGARIIGNYFEKCGFCAISAKSVQDFIFTDNVIVNGMITEKNSPTEGAISYAPAYQAGSIARPRAVIANNIIDTPGGTSTVKQVGIAVRGLAASRADQFIISNNVLSGCGNGITLNHVDSCLIEGNIINGSSDGSSTEDGILFNNCSGDIAIRGNQFTIPNGYGIFAIGGNTAAKFSLTDNTFHHTTVGKHAIIFRDVASIFMDGNEINSTTFAVSIAQAGAPVARIQLGENSISGSVGISWSNITNAFGKLRHTASPNGIITPGEVGTVCVQTAGNIGLWVATGLTSSSWVLYTPIAGSAPSGTVGIGAGTGATISITGNSKSGVITLTTGTSPVANAGIASIVFSSGFEQSPKSVVLTAANPNALNRMPNIYVAPAAILTTGFSLSNYGSALLASLSYQYYYQVI